MKTKADLLAENKALRLENKRLEHKTQELIRHRDMLFDISDDDQKRLKIERSAHDGTITKYVASRNESGQLLVEKCTLENTNKKRGGSSYQKYKPVHSLAARYFQMKLRHTPDYFAGRAAGEVRNHCLKHPDRFQYVPAQKTIKEKLRASA